MDDVLVIAKGLLVEEALEKAGRDISKLCGAKTLELLEPS